MTRFAIFSAALVLAVPAAAQGQSQTHPKGDSGTAAPNSKLESLLENCDAHKFETMVDSVVDGQPHRSKVKMCGKEGQSDADWIATLKDAIAKLDANKDMPASTREQIVSAINAEIARLSSLGTTTTNDALPAGRSASQSSAPLSNDYTLLPPLKTTAPPPPRVLPPADEAALAASAAPAVSTAPKAQAAAPPPPPSKPAMANPRLSFSCINPDYPGGGPCVTLGRDTIVTVKAPAAVAGGLSLRFVRQGDARAELPLGPLRKGQTVRVDLPRAVCSGVVTSEVVMQVVGGGQVLDRQGPYLLRC
jgi:hypothetical protein